MRERWLGCALILALSACSADSGGDSGPRRTQSGAPVTPMVGSAGSGAAAGSGAPGNFGNPTQPAPMTATPGPGTGVGPMNNLCEVVHLTAKPTTPDILIVLDRSGSMGREARWEPSAQAVRTITADLSAKIHFGLALFPQPPASTANGGSIDITPCLSDPDPTQCLNDLLIQSGVTSVCTPGTVIVPVGADTAPMIASTLDMTIPEGGTPTGETLQNLVGTFGKPPSDPDMIPPPKFVLLVTDGQPTCPAGNGEDTTQPDIDLSNMAIDALLKEGVRTYVIGYNTTGPGNEKLAAVLDGFAQRGGTGDMMHRPVEDEQSLRDEFQRIAGDVISCTFVLDKAPPRADYVLVRVDGTQVNLDDPDGWHLVGDRTVELTGSTCESLKADGAHIVDAEVRCEVVTPI